MIQHLPQPLRQWLERLRQPGRREAVPPTPLELREQVLAAIRAALQPHRKARGPIPINRIEVWCSVADPNLRQLYEQALFHELPPLPEDVSDHLRERGWHLMEGWTCVARMTEAFQLEWQVPPGQPVYVLALRTSPESVPVAGPVADPATSHPESAPPPAARLEVLTGRAEETTYLLDPRTPMTIGRGAHHRYPNGAPRQNLLVFLDDHPELTEAERRCNERVSRIHATIRYEQHSRAWRLLRDSDKRLVRYQGTTRQEVSTNQHQYVYLKNGDLIELGEGGARLRFVLLPPEQP